MPGQISVAIEPKQPPEVTQAPDESFWIEWPGLEVHLTREQLQELVSRAMVAQISD